MAEIEHASGISDLVRCSDLREGGYVMLKNRPCKIEETSTFDRGKHGNAKVRLVGIDLFTGEKYEDVLPDNQNVDVPIVNSREYTLINIDATNSFMSLIDKAGEMREDLKLPDSDVGKEITTLVENGDGISVEILKACGEEMAVSVRKTTKDM